MLCGTLTLLASPSGPAHAQARPTATSKFSLQVGVGASGAKPDYDSKYMAGIAVYGDIDYKDHLGIEAEYHYLNLYSPLDIAENTLLAGPRYKFNFGRLHPYAKAVGGIGTFEFIKGYYPSTTTHNYTAIAVGGGVDYDLAHHITVRVDAEYQDWLNFKPNGLTPYVGTVGFAYRFR
jgi:opacity protein-like surface antigen